MEVYLLSNLHHYAMDYEMLTVDELRHGSGGVIAGTIFRPHTIVDGIARLVDMQFVGTLQAQAANIVLVTMYASAARPKI